MGRHRKPTTMKVEHSSLRDDRDRIDVDGADLDEIEVPEILASEAFEIFRDLVYKVKEMNILMPIDCYMLAMLANDIYEYGQIIQKMKEPDQELLVKDDHGKYRRNPLLIAKNKLSENIQTIGKLYGFTPINWAGLPIEYDAVKKKNESGKGKVSGFEDKWGSI